VEFAVGEKPAVLAENIAIVAAPIEDILTAAVEEMGA